MTEIAIGKVKLDLDDVWDAITDDQFVDELNERSDHTDVIEWVAVAISVEEPRGVEEDDLDPFFRPLSDWDREALKLAIERDDGRRAIDVLRRLA